MGGMIAFGVESRFQRHDLFGTGAHTKTAALAEPLVKGYFCHNQIPFFLKDWKFFILFASFGGHTAESEKAFRLFLLKTGKAVHAPPS